MQEKKDEGDYEEVMKAEKKGGCIYIIISSCPRYYASADIRSLENKWLEI